MTKALQDLIEPEGICYGCGPVNKDGIQIKSFPDSDGIHVNVIITPKEKYCGWPGLVYGGYLAMVIDCHSNYTAMAAHYKAEGREPGSLPKISCATGTLSVKYLKPTPMDVELLFKARVEGEVGRKTRIICEVYANNILTAIGDSIFVRVDTDELAQVADRIKNPPCPVLVR